MSMGARTSFLISVGTDGPVAPISTTTLSYLYHNYTFIWMNAYTYTRWKVEVRPSLEIVFTFLKEKIKEPLFNFDYERASRRPH